MAVAVFSYMAVAVFSKLARSKFRSYYLAALVGQQGTLSCCETHVFVHCTFINLMNVPNIETLVFFWYQQQTI